MFKNKNVSFVYKEIYIYIWMKKGQKSVKAYEMG